MATTESIIAEIDELNSRVSKVNTDRKEMKMRMRAITADIINAISEIKGKNSAMKSEIQQQARQIQEKEAELAVLRTKGAENVANGADLEKLIDRLGKEIATKDQKLNELTAELAEYESRKSSTDKQLEEHGAKMSELEKQIEADKISLGFYEKNQQTLEEQIRQNAQDLKTAIDDIRASYSNLRASVERLMLEVTNDEQEKNLNDILDALGENEKAAIASALQEVPQIVSPGAEANVEGFDEFEKELDEKISKYFDLQSDGTYTIKSGMAIPAGNDRMIVSKEIFDKLKNLEALKEELKNKVLAYRQYSGISPPRSTAGGSRKRRKTNNSKKTKKRRVSSTRKRKQHRRKGGKSRKRGRIRK